VAREAEIKITVDSKSAQRELDKLDKSLDETSKQSKKTSLSVADVGKTLAKGALAFAAAAAAVGVFIKSQIRAADEIGKTADKIGVGISELQELRFAAGQAGVDVRNLDVGLQRFSRRVGEAAKGTGVLAKVFKEYGIETQNAQGRTRVLGDVLNDYADVIANTEDSQEQLRLAFKAFDTEGAALVNLLRKGSIGLQEFRNRAKELGGILEDDTVRGAEALQDALGELSEVFASKLNKGLAVFVELARQLDVIPREEIGKGAKTVEELEEALDAAAIPMRALILEEQKLLKITKDMMADGDVRAAAQTLLNKNLTEQEQRQTQINIALEKYHLLVAAGATDEQAEADLRAAEAAETLRVKQAAHLEFLKLTQPELMGAKESIEVLADAYLTGAIGLKEYELWLTKIIADLGLMDEELAEVQRSLFQGMPKAAKEGGTKTSAELQAVADAARKTAGAMSSAFVDFALTGEQSFSDMTESILADLAKLIIQTQIMNALTSAFPGMLSPAANGAVMSNGNMTAFAKGGVVSSPTVFPMKNGAGLMGEAGPEAIMPLTRGKGGKLGVQASGGGGVTVNIINESGNEAEVTTSSDGMTIDVMISKAVNQGLGNGSFDKSLNSSFGLSRKGR